MEWFKAIVSTEYFKRFLKQGTVLVVFTSVMDVVHPMMVNPTENDYSLEVASMIMMENFLYRMPILLALVFITYPIASRISLMIRKKK